MFSYDRSGGRVLIYMLLRRSVHRGRLGDGAAAYRGERSQSPRGLLLPNIQMTKESHVSIAEDGGSPSSQSIAGDLDLIFPDL